MSDLGSATPSTRRRAKVKPYANGKPDPSQELLHALQAMRSGDFSVRMTGDHLGIEGKIADTFNEIVAANQRMAQQLERVGQVVGREGKTRQRVKFGLASGSWADMEGSVNTLIDDLLWPTREVTRAVAAVAQGDLLQTVQLDVDGRPLGGEFLQSATIVNTMIKQLSVFTSEVTRVAREVGTEGKLGGQAQVPEVTGVWKDLTESVNSMASNLTGQVRNIAEVTIAVANGDLSKKITVDVRGEILQLKEAINTMVDQLRSFASEVTRVAREVGTDGKLGGQAMVPGRGRHLEGPHRPRELDGRQPDGAGAQHRRSDHRGGARRPVAQDHGRRSRRNSGAQEHHQHDGRPAQLLRLRSDPRGARGRHRRQARRPGPSARRRRHLEGSHRQRQLHGRRTSPPRSATSPKSPPPLPTATCRKKITVDVQRRNPAAQENHQHHGGPAQRVRRRSDARGARGRHRRQAGRPGQGAGRRRHMEGFDRQRQLHGRQPDRPGPQHRRGDHRRCQRRPVEEDHGGRRGEILELKEHHQHDGGPAQRLRLAKSRAWRAKSAPKASWAARRKCMAWPAPGRT